MDHGIRGNWRILCEQLTGIRSKIQLGKRDFTPISRLGEALVFAETLLERIEKESIYKVGNLNMKREATAIVNRIKGMQYDN